MILAIGTVLAAAGGVLLLDLAGAGRAVMRGLTSRSLGPLPPGYAASTGGFRVYSVLLLALGVAMAGAGVAPAQPLAGGAGILIGLAAFLIGSVLAIRGEVKTYRRLQRPK